MAFVKAELTNHISGAFISVWDCNPDESCLGIMQYTNLISVTFLITVTFQITVTFLITVTIFESRT